MDFPKSMFVLHLRRTLNVPHWSNLFSFLIQLTNKEMRSLIWFSHLVYTIRWETFFGQILSLINIARLIYTLALKIGQITNQQTGKHLLATNRKFCICNLMKKQHVKQKLRHFENSIVAYRRKTC